MTRSWLQLCLLENLETWLYERYDVCMDHKSLEYLFNQNELNLRPLNDLNCLRTMITLLAIISVRKLNGCKVVTQLMKIMVTVHKRKRTKFNVYNFKDEIFIREEECNGPAHTHKNKKK